MPCFQESVLWIEMEEQDLFQIDKSQIAMACKNLQLGTNKLIMHIQEDNAGISNGASVISVPGSTNFTFGDPSPNTAQYTFTFNVSQNCFLPSNQAEII